MFCTKCGAEMEENTQFCTKCGAKIEKVAFVEPEKQQLEGQPIYTQSTYNQQQVKQKSKKPLVFGIIGIVVAAILVIMFILSHGSNKYVNMVKNGSPYSYPNQTYGEEFDSFFEDPSWSYFSSTDNEDVVEFRGSCSYGGENADILIQFVIFEDSGTFDFTYMEMNGVEQDEWSMWALIDAVFGN